MTRPLTIEEKYEKTRDRIWAVEEDMPNDNPVAYFFAMMLAAMEERLRINPWMHV